MAQISEAVGQQSQLKAVITSALDQIGLRGQVVFQAYSRVVLPLDGYVFWVPTTQLTVVGTLHFAQEIVQSEDETFGLAHVQLDTDTKVTEFDVPGDDTLYVATVGPFRYAFSSQGGYQDDVRLWHYAGRSITPAMAAQLLDAPGSIDPAQAVVSNSLPLWLALNGWSTGFSDWLSNASKAQGGLGITLYPSDIVLPNLTPPYGVVRIGPDDTRALQAVPYRDANSDSWQLAADRVRITLYGLQNNAAVDFLNLVLQYIEYTGNLGLMSMPVIRDGKRGQIELQAIAMQKVIDFEVSYNQARVASVARTLILSALPTYVINTQPLSPLNVIDSGGAAVVNSGGGGVTSP